MLVVTAAGNFLMKSGASDKALKIHICNCSSCSSHIAKQIILRSTIVLHLNC